MVPLGVLATTDADVFAPAFLRTELDKHLRAIARRAGVRLADAREALDTPPANG